MLQIACHARLAKEVTELHLKNFKSLDLYPHDVVAMLTNISDPIREGAGYA